MGTLLSRLWSDSDFFVKSCVAALAFIAVLLPLLPLGELGPIGFWIGKLALPLIIALGATSKGSGLKPEEVAEFRAWKASMAPQKPLDERLT